MPGLGWLPDAKKRAGEKPDLLADDFLAAKVSPKEASLRHLVHSVLNQGNLGSCVTNAGLQAVRASHMKQGVQAPKLGSRLFTYYLCRAMHHTTAVDSGTQMRAFFTVLNKFGFCPEDVYPYNDRLEPYRGDAPPFTRMPTTAAFRAAFDQRSPTTYRRIHTTGYDRVASIKRALAAGYLVPFGTEVSQAFVDDDFDSQLPLDPPRKEPMAGGHAMCLVGYSGDTFDVVNSWGTSWGDNGYFKLSSDYVVWSETVDFWIVEHSPRYSE